jgi:hypothetical protein
VDVDKFLLVKKTLCAARERNGKPKMSCIVRECDSCGSNILQDYFKGQDEAKHVSWYQGLFVKVDGKRKPKLSNFNGALQQLSEMLQEHVHDLALHLFIATWQQEQLFLAL